MADIKDLPGAGEDFRINSRGGKAGFRKKLERGTRFGELKNLRNNRKTIVSAVNPYEKVIKRAGLSGQQKLKVIRKIIKTDKNLTKEDLKEVKKLVDQLGASAYKKQKTATFKSSSSKSSTQDTERKPTLMEKRAMKVKADMMKNRNKARSRSARDEQEGGGAMRVEGTRRFAGGGSVTTKSMVGGISQKPTGMVGTSSDPSNGATFAGSKSNLSKNNISPNKGLGNPPSRPLGF